MSTYFVRVILSFVFRALSPLVPKSVGECWRKLSLKVQWALVVMLGLIVLGGPILWQYFTPQGAALYSHNHTERPISSYSVNGYGGGNAFAYGGGKTTCCWSIRGDQLKVLWIKSMTGKQARQGVKAEQVGLVIPNPPRQRQDDTLHVHFLPGDQVRVAWSDSHTSPLKDQVKAILAKDAL